MVEPATTTVSGCGGIGRLCNRLLTGALEEYCCFFDVRRPALFDRLDIEIISVQVDLCTTDFPHNGRRELHDPASEYDVFAKSFLRQFCTTVKKPEMLKVFLK